MGLNAIVFDGRTARCQAIAADLTKLRFAVRPYDNAKFALQVLREDAKACDLVVTTDIEFARSARAVAPSASIILIDSHKATHPRLLMPGLVVAHSTGEAALSQSISVVMGNRIRGAGA